MPLQRTPSRNPASTAARPSITRLSSIHENDGAGIEHEGEQAPRHRLEAARWLVEREVVIVGSDTWSTEVVPNPDSSLAFPVHQLLIPRNGIYIFENLLTEELARDRVYEFAFFFAPLISQDTSTFAPAFRPGSLKPFLRV